MTPDDAARADTPAGQDRTPAAPADGFWLRVFQMIGLPFLFLPITTASYAGLPPDKTGQAAALINVARNIGGSATGHFLAQGAAEATARQQAFDWIGRLVEDQASLLSYIDVFQALAVVALLMIPVALLLRRGRSGGAAH